jgi:hypothetical protein
MGREPDPPPVRQKVMNKMWRGGVAATVLLISLGACASGGGRRSTEAQAPSASATTTAAPVAVTMTRTGGFAGVRQRIAIAPDGSWTRTERSGATTSGQLTADQIAQLQQLAQDPGLSAEKTPASGKRICADAFVYTLSVGAGTIAYTDCNACPPKASQLVALIAGWILTT